jgi:hypothetical protein
MALSKFSVCYKDCQSGKTFEQFLRVRKQMEEGKKYFYIFFTDNFKLQSSQLNKRFNAEFPDKGLPIQLNSNFKYSTKQRREIPLAEQNCAEYYEVANLLLDCPDRDTLMVLSNSFRTEDLTQNLNKWCRAGGYDGVQVWFDEIDRTTHLFKETIPTLNEHPDVVGVVGLTGTGLQKLFEELKVNELSLIPVSRPHENFMGFNEHQFRNTEMDLDDSKLFGRADVYSGYASKVLAKEKFVKPGVHAFIPSHVHCAKQDYMTTLLMAYKFDVVVLVNGEQRVVYRKIHDSEWGPEDYDGIFKSLVEDVDNRPEHALRLETVLEGVRACYESFDLSDNIETPLEHSIAKLSRENNWKNLSVAVTGHNCITRGVTIQSKDFVFTHAILPLLFTINASDADNVSSRKRADDFYQLCARINGSTRQWNNDTGVRVYTSAESQAFLQGYCNIPQDLAQRCPNRIVKKEQYTELLTTVFQYVDRVGARRAPPKPEKKEADWSWATTHLMDLGEFPVGVSLDELKGAVDKVLSYNKMKPVIKGCYKIEGRRYQEEGETLCVPELSNLVKSESCYYTYNNGKTIGTGEPIIKLRSDLKETWALNMKRGRYGDTKKADAYKEKCKTGTLVETFMTHVVRDNELKLSPVMRVVIYK